MVQVHIGKRGKYNNAKVGGYIPMHPEKCKTELSKLVFKSALEQRMMLYLDKNTAIVSWKYEPKSIRYFDKATQKVRRYFIDFEAQAKVGPCIKTIWIEVKPYCESIPPTNKKNSKAIMLWLTNSSKWEAASKLAKSKGAEFHVITERQLI